MSTDAARPGDPFERAARVLDQRTDSDGSVLVTFALPALRTATVRFPFSQWLEGQHIRVGHHLAAAVIAERELAAIVPPPGED